MDQLDNYRFFRIRKLWKFNSNSVELWTRSSFINAHPSESRRIEFENFNKIFFYLCCSRKYLLSHRREFTAQKCRKPWKCSRFCCTPEQQIRQPKSQNWEWSQYRADERESRRKFENRKFHFCWVSSLLRLQARSSTTILYYCNTFLHLPSSYETITLTTDAPYSLTRLSTFSILFLCKFYAARMFDSFLLSTSPFRIVHTTHRV